MGDDIDGWDDLPFSDLHFIDATKKLDGNVAEAIREPIEQAIQEMIFENESEKVELDLYNNTPDNFSK